MMGWYNALNLAADYTMRSRALLPLPTVEVSMLSHIMDVNVNVLPIPIHKLAQKLVVTQAEILHNIEKSLAHCHNYEGELLYVDTNFAYKLELHHVQSHKKNTLRHYLMVLQ